MRMRNLTLLGAATALALAGCDSGPAAPTDSETAPATMADTDTSLAEPGDESVARAANELRTIPARFLGTWDHVEGSCDPASDLRMEIGQRRIMFYESVGDVTGIQAENDNAIVVTMSMTGEGESWQETTRLTIEDGGDRLVPSSADGEGGYEPMPRKKCAA